MASKLFDQFLIGSWVTYFPYDIMSHEEQMKRLTELGVNYHPFPFSWYEPETHDDIEDWKEIDRLCQKYGVLYGMEATANKCGNSDEAFENNIAFAKEMGDNLVAYHIFDEPTGSEVQMLGDWVRRYRTADQRVWPIFNLNPSSVSVRRLNATYERYLQQMIDAAGAENMAFLSHDFYPFMADGSTKEAIFTDMENIRKAAYENGKLHTHAFLQAYGDEREARRMPNIEEIRWQAYCYIAYGFKALSYFNMVSPRPNPLSSFSNGLILQDGSVPDPVLLENVGKLNWELRAVGNEMLSMQTVHAYHTHEIDTYYATGIIELLPEDYRIQPLDKERKFIVTEHETKDRFMIVNNDFEWEGEAKFAVSGANGISVFDPATKEYRKCEYENGILTVTFRKGEGLLFKSFKGESMKQIWAKGSRDEMNVALTFSYTLPMTEDTILDLASNVSFRLSIDGKMIGYGPRRRAHGRAAINRYSLREYAGKTVCIDVECVSYRVENFYIVNQTPFFAAEIEQSGKIIANSFDFKAYKNASKLQKVQRFAYQRGFVEAYKIDGEPNLIPVETDEQTVCVLEESCAPYPKFTELKAEEFESGNIFGKSTFEEYDDAYLNRRGAKHYSREEQEYRITLENDKYGFEKTDKAGETLCRQYKAYRLPRNAAGFIAFDIEVTEDANVMINYDEKLSPLTYQYCEKFRSDAANEANLCVDRSADFRGEASNIDVYRLHSLSLINYKLTRGRYALTAFEPDEMQYIRFYVIDGKAKISNVRLITYENEKVKAEFRSEDEDLNLIFDAAINTFKANAVDVLTDCPSRERAGWLCDTYFTGRAEKIITGDNAVEKNTLEAFRDYKAGDCPCVPRQVFPMCYPSDHTTQGGRYIPNWCMWLVLELESYMERSGDRALIQAMKEKVLAFVEFELGFANSDGLLEDLEGWVFVEWSRANDLTNGVNYPTNMLFSRTLKAVARLYGEEKYAKLAANMDEQIVKQSFNGKFFVDNATRNGKGELVRNTEWTETCQYYAFWCGYADKERYSELFEIIFDEIHNYTDLSEKYPTMSRADSFIGLYLRLDYLSRIRENEKVVRDLKNFFLFQAKETKTFWEYKTPSGSCCHAFASLMCEWILKAVIGMEKVDANGVTLKDDRVPIKATAKIPYGDKVFTVE